MFTIVINGRTFKVKFQHDHTAKRTFCFILNVSAEEQSVESVKFNPKDNPRQYSKWTGKMLALTKVLRLLDFSKDERREIWTAFHQNFPQKRRH